MKVEAFALINKWHQGFRLGLEPFFIKRADVLKKCADLRTFLILHLHNSNKNAYLCSAKLTVVINTDGHRIDAQYEIGLFLCPSVNHIVGIHELVPYTKFVDIAICDKSIRLSFPTFICSTVNAMVDLAITGNDSRSCIHTGARELAKTAKSTIVLCYNQIQRCSLHHHQPTKHG